MCRFAQNEVCSIKTAKAKLSYSFIKFTSCQAEQIIFTPHAISVI